MSKMKTDFVRFKTEDGLELQGLFSLPSDQKPDRGIVHVHGTAGNFYEHRFIDKIREMGVSNGLAFFTFNNRGHDLSPDFIRETKDGFKSETIGGDYEVFEECIFDIKAALDFLEERGIRKVILQGHSLGPNKIAYYQNQENDPRVKAAIFLSPCNDVGLQKENLKEKFEEINELAERLVKEGKGRQLLPDGTFFIPVSGVAYWGYVCPKSVGNVFPYHDKRNEFKILKSIDYPVIAVFGGADPYIKPSPKEAGKIFKKLGLKETHIVPDAPHNFFGHEDELADLISDWLEKII